MREMEMGHPYRVTPTYNNLYQGQPQAVDAYKTLQSRVSSAFGRPIFEKCHSEERGWCGVDGERRENPTVNLFYMCHV